MTHELYSQIVRVLTNYENPNDTELTKEELIDDMYSTLVDIQNAIDNGDLLWGNEVD